MSMMLSRNGIRIGIVTFPDQKRPSLCYERIGSGENTVYKVASFISERSAKAFEDVILQFLEGLVEDGRTDQTPDRMAGQSGASGS